MYHEYTYEINYISWRKYKIYKVYKINIKVNTF